MNKDNSAGGGIVTEPESYYFHESRAPEAYVFPDGRIELNEAARNSPCLASAFRPNTIPVAELHRDYGDETQQPHSTSD